MDWLGLTSKRTSAIEYSAAKLDVPFDFVFTRPERRAELWEKAYAAVFDVSFVVYVRHVHSSRSGNNSAFLVPGQRGLTGHAG